MTPEDDHAAAHRSETWAQSTPGNSWGQGEVFGEDVEDFDEDDCWDPGPRRPWVPDPRSAYDRRFPPVGPEAEAVRAQIDHRDQDQVGQSAAALAVGVGLAVRRHRADLSVGQRAYARLRGWSKSHVSRIEASAGSLNLDTVVAALAGTGYGLALVRDVAPRDPSRGGRGGANEVLDDGPPARPSGDAVAPDEWTDLELVARDRRGRRFPATEQVEEARRYENRYHSRRYDYSRDLPRWVWHRSESWWDSSGSGDTSDGTRTG